MAANDPDPRHDGDVAARWVWLFLLLAVVVLLATVLAVGGL